MVQLQIFIEFFEKPKGVGGFGFLQFLIKFEGVPLRISMAFIRILMILHFSIVDIHGTLRETNKVTL